MWPQRVICRWPLAFSASVQLFLCALLGSVLGPDDRIWAQILTPADIFMSCTALAGSFGSPKCSFCLIVEILGSVLGPVAPFGPKFLAERPDVWPARHFCATALHFLPQSGILRTLFGPSCPFWAQVFSRKARLCGHTATFEAH
jgi:hypothetical protein